VFSDFFLDRGVLVAIIIACLGMSCVGVAQNYSAPSNPVIGSANTVTANAPVPRPETTPCVVQLFSNLDFADFNPKYFSYAPPANCPGPWAAVVINADWSIDAGRQFDRTAEIWVGGANVYFGTTAEPSATVARSWHVESNLTDYSPLFAGPQNGEIDLGNLVNGTYTSVIHGSAYIQFYPVSHRQQAPRTADVVLPMSAGPTGGTVTLNTTSDQLTKTWSFPTNVERAYLDVFSQSQSGDEFWYSCAPNDVANELVNCGGSAFREAEVSIDGQSAGVAPVYPWIYTGGIDPYLWRPIPGVHTLNFQPYRVDLTPFAGLLSNGQQHTVAVNVFNANGYFSETATLLLYLDAGSTQVTGAVTRNTIGQPQPVVGEHLKVTNNGNNVKGVVTDTSTRGYTLDGYVMTSHGRVDTQIVQSIDFSNTQHYTIANSTATFVDNETVNQNTEISSITKTTDGGRQGIAAKHESWPLKLDVQFTQSNIDGSFVQTTNINQKLDDSRIVTLDGRAVYYSEFSDSVTPADTLSVSTTVTTSGQSNIEKYSYNDSTGACWNQTNKAASGVLTSVSGGSCDSTKH
jgi:hypothetical protein